MSSAQDHNIGNQTSATIEKGAHDEATRITGPRLALVMVAIACDIVSSIALLIYAMLIDQLIFQLVAGILGSIHWYVCVCIIKCLP